MVEVVALISGLFFNSDKKEAQESEMSVDCIGIVGETLGATLGDCVVSDRGVIEIIEAVVKHESKLRRLIKALKKCCVHSSSSSDEEITKK
jgi:hypothetical protein